METFKELGLSDNLIAVLEKNNITVPTAIQKKAIPFVLEGKDIVGISATGSGKTLAFSVGILEHIAPTGIPQALILTPTRELAEQVASAIRQFALKKIRVFAAYGGVNIEEHMKKIRDADVIVATPGRLWDLLERGTFSVKGIKTLVLDEFDRMLDMGFHKDINPIIGKCPKDRQTMLFSATKSEKVEELIEEYTRDAIEIGVTAFVDHTKLEQRYYRVPEKDKFSLLVHLLKMDKSESLIIFCSKRVHCDFVSENLNDMGFDTLIIHGGIDQKNRTKRLRKFHNDGGILVCTDVAARGLDIKNVNHVYNYGMPRFPEDYIHRVGRTARAGKEGKAITLVSEKDKEMFDDIMDIEGVNVTEMKTPKVQKVLSKEIKIEKIKGRIIRKKHTSKGWVSIQDPGLSNRFLKRTVAKYWTKDDDTEEEYIPRNKSRTNGSRRNKRKKGSSSSKKKNSSHKPAKGKKTTRGRAGTRKTGKKVSRRPKGRANRRTKK
jgi:ATP-dependent RNA helicase DeaD